MWQVKQQRARQEQASTYLQLVCSSCDLALLTVRETAGAIQQVKLQVGSLQEVKTVNAQVCCASLSFFVKTEEYMLLCEEVADSWRDVEEQKADLEAQLKDTEQQLQILIRRPAELEPRIAQNQLDKAQVCEGSAWVHSERVCCDCEMFLQEFLQQVRERQSEVNHLNGAVIRLTNGEASPTLEGMKRLKRGWMEMGQRAEELEAQRGEDMQRSGEYQESAAAVEELFHQVSREWDYLARYGP